MADNRVGEQCADSLEPYDRVHWCAFCWLSFIEHCATKEVGNRVVRLVPAECAAFLGNVALFWDVVVHS